MNYAPLEYFQDAQSLLSIVMPDVGVEKRLSVP